MRWSAGIALLLGCSATGNTDPSTDSVDDALGRVSQRPAPPPRGPGRGPGRGHGPGHFPGHPPGQHHPGHGNGPGAPGAGGGTSSSGGSGGTSAAGAANAGQSNGSGAAAGTAGTFTGSAGMAGGGSIDPGVCGDGIVGAYEQCDDGNATVGDGCDTSCVVEPGFTCNWGEPCRAVSCGDGFIDSYATGDGSWDSEQCDDGNSASGDGCSAACEPEPGFYCFAPGESCKDVVCGDGAADPYYVLVEGSGGSGGTAGTGSAGFAGSGPTEPYIGFGYEVCDDGNTTSGDGCNATCEPESGWICDQPGQPCRKPRCGDGYIDFVEGRDGTGGFGGFAGGTSSGSYEQCDDANATSGDGCSAECFVEAGYSCPWNGQPCKLAVCGDGIVDYPSEDCDDGPSPSGFCTSSCHYDFGSAGSGSAGYTGVGGGVTAGSGSGVGGTLPQGGRSARGG
ncbi:MAG TPA: DUF4215 domain-containing protein [Polyangiaceae bacterium]|nr:DUF4215 domain-containing protein [Polyangiaceae bacterium]